VTSGRARVPLFAAAFEPLVLSKMSGDRVFRSRPEPHDPPHHPEIVATTEERARFRRPSDLRETDFAFVRLTGGHSEILPAALAMKLRPTRDPCFSLLNTALKPRRAHPGKILNAARLSSTSDEPARRASSRYRAAIRGQSGRLVDVECGELGRQHVGTAPAESRARVYVCSCAWHVHPSSMHAMVRKRPWLREKRP
jgi:hypothetical protein